jgi:outer membrane murein-binding lipoprotein Lpp
MCKKSIVVLSLILSVVALASCTADNEKITEQSETISSLQSQNSSLKKEISDLREIKNGETVEISGIVRVGKTLSAGYYNIESKSNKEEMFLFYKDKEAFEKNESKNELLIPDSSGQKTNIRHNYKLEKGNILEILDPLFFTRTG